jgi:hypothetical protein
LLLISGNSIERNRPFIEEKDIKINFEENISVNGSTYRGVHGIYWKGALLTDKKLSEVSPDEALALILALSGRLDEFSQGNPIYKNGYLNYFTMDSSMELILDQCRWITNHLATSPGPAIKMPRPR